jgi:ubiquinone/menaquinone biosynthesis C-methylase UbiE
MISYINNYEKLFDAFTRKYYLLDYLSFGLTIKLRTRAIINTAIPDGGVVIDLMCGTGNNIVNLRNKVSKDVKYIGFDISGNMIKKAISYHSELTNARFLKENLFNISTKNYKADLVLCSFGMKCIKPFEYEKFAEIISSLISKNGTFSFTEFQLPASLLFRCCVRIYFQTIFRLVCLICTGNAKPVNALLEVLSQRMDLKNLKIIFLEKGIELSIKEKWNKSLIFISGKRIAV